MGLPGMVYLGCGILAMLLLFVAYKNSGARENKINEERKPRTELQIVPPPLPKKTEETKEENIEEEKPQEKPQEKSEEKKKIRVPKKHYFDSSGKTFSEIEGLDCESPVLAFMSDTTLEICQLVCTSDPECGVFVFAKNSDCNTYSMCKRIFDNGETTLFTREK